MLSLYMINQYVCYKIMYRTDLIYVRSGQTQILKAMRNKCILLFLARNILIPNFAL